MIDVRAIANAAIQPINENIDGMYLASTGYTTSPAFKQIPSYAPPVPVKLQVQATTNKQLEHLEKLNIQGITRNVRMFGDTQGVMRVDARGGDLLQFPEVPAGTVRNWKVVQVLETWPTWCSLIVNLQTDAVGP